MAVQEETREKKDAFPVRRAEEAGQTINVDLCFVPLTHEPTHKLPAVSGSSGRLVVERLAQNRGERDWPGRVFEDGQRDYVQAMLDYVEASQAQTKRETTQTSETVSHKAQQRVLRQEADRLRLERRVTRQQRAQEDTAWKMLKAHRRHERTDPTLRTRVERRAQNMRWRIHRDQRRATLQQREVEDAQWRAQRRTLRQQLDQLPPVTTWLAILVITDNCTRQCLGLPLFVAGARVTAKMVVQALRDLLPAELQFLISDRGTHFTADVFAQLAEDETFVHVVIARHRPQSNGIAERFVRTLKEWLRDKDWQDERELAILLDDFLLDYNNRPHQGLPNQKPLEPIRIPYLQWF